MILYFTGTGNSQYIAKRMKEKTSDDMICINDRIKRKDTGSIAVSGDSIGKADRHNQELCVKKNWTYMGTAQIVMPENYIAMFPVPDEKEAGKIIEAAEPAIEQAISCIQMTKKFMDRKGHFWDGLLSGLVNRLFYPLFVKATPFYVKDSCVSCGKCVSLCPLSNTRLEKEKPVWGSECTHCMACICSCHKEAIEYGKKSKGKPRYHCK